jgi:hypothetical protein
MRRSLPYKISPFRRWPRGTLKHRFERLLHGGSGPVRKAGNDGARGKYFGVTGKHIRRHGASRRQPGNEDATPVDSMVNNRFFDHLPN